ncbi:MAG: GAF domain-containing protein, partial [Bacteroidetes bacterium]|nr:GAF domain-containing protein [Bacteroidota bacterium]
MTTIRAKLISSFAIILLIMISIAFFVLYQLDETNNRMYRMVEVSAERINLSNELMIGLLQVTRFEKNIIIEPNDLLRKAHIDEAYRHSTLVSQKLLELDQISTLQYIVKGLNEAWSEYMLVLDKIVALSEQSQVDAAFRLSDQEARASRNAVIMLAENVIKVNKENMAQDWHLSENAFQNTINLMIFLIILSSIFIVAISYLIIKGIKKRIGFIANAANKIANREFSSNGYKDSVKDELQPISNSLFNISKSFEEVTANANAVASGDYSADIVPLSRQDALGRALRKMTISLREATAENEKNNWLVTGQNQINYLLRGDRAIEELAERLIVFLVPYLNASIGSVYLLDEKEHEFLLKGSYALNKEIEIKERFYLGEGLAGQAAKENRTIILDEISNKHLRISSSIVETLPGNILIVPFTFENKPLGVIEIGKIGRFSVTEIEIVESLAETIGISMNSALARKYIQNLLEETQNQSEELQSQSEELQTQSEEISQANSELEEQAQQLRQQQEELKTSNEELQEQTQELEEKNSELEKAKRDIEEKGREIELSSKYKSEFLANMSHELRTPLNSLLILSKDLADNSLKNLNPDQVESAEIIYKSGQDLLVLINEVLDLAKIEAGKMNLVIEELNIENLVFNLEQRFKHQVLQKGLSFETIVAEDLPKTIFTDQQRLLQILKNLLSNAIKFTDEGAVLISVSRHSDDEIAFNVSDTGIGIPKEKQGLIFEAFQQAEGGTSRKYGGTGLGLSISRELASLIKGKIELKSNENEGSTFTLIIPVEIKAPQVKEIKKAPKPAEKASSAFYDGRKEYINYPSIKDDRESVNEQDRVVLIIEDDHDFAIVLQKLAKERGFKCLSAASGEDGILLAEQYLPNAIILDLSLPGINGNIVLTELKSNPDLRHIPVHII